MNFNNDLGKVQKILIVALPHKCYLLYIQYYLVFALLDCLRHFKKHW